MPLVTAKEVFKRVERAEYAVAIYDTCGGQSDNIKWVELYRITTDRPRGIVLLKI